MMSLSKTTLELMHELLRQIHRCPRSYDDKKFRTMLCSHNFLSNSLPSTHNKGCGPHLEIFIFKENERTRIDQEDECTIFE